MRRKWFPLIAVLVLFLLVAVLLLLLPLRAPSPAPNLGLPEGNAVDPVRTEIDCIDRVLANGNLTSEEVQPALDRCRSQGARETRLVNGQ